ncbi:MAG: restriction endonuclease [Halobacteriales archaeon SW_9_67_25]|nr:MAG: restriction endonuclease [Halobacteriales archaeon SW_9_67_25]
MDLTLDPTVAEGYTSKAQRSRVITETWAGQNLYCPNCDAEAVDAHRPGKRVEDFRCPTCDRRIQLKATRGSHGRKVSNSAYEPKMEAIRNDEAPDYTFIGFDPEVWRVTDLFLVPGHFMTPTVVEKREPLSSDARRSGWVGSNILLDRIPEPGRIEIVREGEARPREEVRATFEQTAFLSEQSVDTRDWTSAVMDCIDDLPVRPGETFELADVYGFEDRLADLYPKNDHVRAKIRQQMQVLRDEGLVEFLGNGEYRLRWVDTRDVS